MVILMVTSSGENDIYQDRREIKTASGSLSRTVLPCKEDVRAGVLGKSWLGLSSSPQILPVQCGAMTVIWVGTPVSNPYTL